MATRETSASRSIWLRIFGTSTRQVTGLRTRGLSAKETIAACKPKIISAYPDWEHPGLIDWEVNYFQAKTS